jgi:hypothetical protein
MNKKGQVQALIPVFIGILVLAILAPVFSEMFNSIGCQREKGDISTLQGQLAQCKNDLSAEMQKANNAASGLEQCRNDLSQCQEDLQNCIDNNVDLKKECDAKEQPINEYYFVKVYSNKIILFEWLILYNIQLFGLFASLGITFSIKLFEVKVHIKVLNKKNQRKLVRDIKNYLAENPWAPVLIVLGIIFITNLPQLINLL